MTTKTESVNSAKATASKAAGKAAGVFYSAKTWVVTQVKKPGVALAIGLALGVTAEYGAQKYLNNRNTAQ